MPTPVRPVTIPPAINAPNAIDGRAFLKGTSKTHAAKHPVHTPVNGKGIATNPVSSSAPYL